MVMDLIGPPLVGYSLICKYYYMSLLRVRNRLNYIEFEPKKKNRVGDRGLVRASVH